MSKTAMLAKSGKIKPPQFVVEGLVYETIMGSRAYGTATPESDYDIYGICIPLKHMVFPHLNGEIDGFGRQKKRFEQFKTDKETNGKIFGDDGKEYEIVIFSIVKFFSLAMENNPNIIDCLFTPINCVTHSPTIGNIIRDNRRMFLHKGCWHKFRNYSYSQLHKMAGKKPQPGSNREAMRAEYGMDVKFAMNVVRLLAELEQILQTGDIDFTRDSEMLKAIRRGDWTEERVREYFTEKEKYLERLYETSSLPYGPDEKKIKTLLLQCLEHHFQSLDNAIRQVDAADLAIEEISTICDRIRRNRQ